METKEKFMSNKSIKKEIAVIGLSGKFPKSIDVKSFWNNLKDGKELIDFFTDDELEKMGVSEELLNDPSYVRAYSNIDEPGEFDFSFFGYSAEEASLMDPQIRHFHQHVWLALEDAGYNPYQYQKKIGLFATASDNLNWRAHSMMNNSGNVNPFYLSQISDKRFISTLVSYNLNLRGPSYFLDTACSSSLTAIHLACRSLLLRECDISVAGGVSIHTGIQKGYLYQDGMINSKDGHCKAFDSEASGTVSGEGLGIVVLKRLEEAVKDNDQIYAVIKSSAVNNDGNRKVGFTAPSVSGQADCIKLAHRIAGIDSSSIAYVEAHGTGTKIGDPIEIEALNTAFNFNKNKHCAIGSVKTNIGHLDAAAGVAGLIKTVMSLKEKAFVPSLHYKKPNPDINFDSGPFFVNTSFLDKQKNSGTLRAGVSSFGIGGTNVHVVLEEAPQIDETLSAQPYQLIQFSAKNEESLEDYHEKLQEHFLSEPKESMANIAYTLQVGRESFQYKKYFVAVDKEESIAILKDEDRLLINDIPLKNKIVFMFPGGGSQYHKMGKGIYDSHPYFKNIIDSGIAHLKPYFQEDLYGILFGDLDMQKEDKINDISFTQPLLFLFEYALAKLIMHWGLKPDTLIGHSLGEHVAACISGVFSFEEGLTLMNRRGKLMKQTDKGAMLNIAQSLESVSSIISPDLSIAAINSLDAVVVSGKIDAIEDLEKKLLKKDIPHTRLRVSIASHSNMMDSILEEYRKEIFKIKLNSPVIPFISNISGKLITEEQATSTEYWVGHLSNTVRFYDGISELLKKDNTMYLEVGPGTTLTSFSKQHELYNSLNNASINLIRHPKEEVDDYKKLLQSLGELWVNGLAINWDTYNENEVKGRVSAPTYQFQKYLFPAKVDPFGQLENNSKKIDLIKKIDFEFPKKANGRSGVIIAKRSNLSNSYIEGRTPTEKKIESIWKHFFRIDKIGINDNFFELGGDSLKALTLSIKIKEEFKNNFGVKSIFKFPTIKLQASAIISKKITAHSLIKAPKMNAYPITEIQKVFWLAAQDSRLSMAYNIIFGWKITGSLDLDKLRQAFNLLLDRHEILHTVIDYDEQGHLKSFIKDKTQFSKAIEVQDYEFTPLSNQIIFKAFDAQKEEVFDLEKGPLFKIKIIKNRNDAWYLFFSIHHIISDHFSLQIIFKDLILLYDSLLKEGHLLLPDLPYSFHDYSYSLNANKSKDENAKNKLFWSTYLLGRKTYVEFPGLNKQGTKSIDAALDTITIDDKKVIANLKKYNREQQGTMYLLLMTLTKTAIYFETNQTDISFGSPISVRNQEELLNVVGLFLNTVIVRSLVPESGSFSDYYSSLQESVAGVMAHSEYSFLEITNLEKEFNSKGGGFNIGFNLNPNSSLENLNVKGFKFEQLKSDVNFVKTDLWFDVLDTEDSIILNVSYRNDTFKRKDVNKLLSRIKILAEKFAGDNSISIPSLKDMVLKEESEMLKHQIKNLKNKNISILKNLQVKNS